MTRRFLGTRKKTVVICSESEYQTARREKRAPVGVGFQLDDVIGAELRKRLSKRMDHSQNTAPFFITNKKSDRR